MYKSVTVQTLHYFARPHQAARTTPIDGPAAWRGCDLATSGVWRHPLSAADIAELDGALAAAKSSGRPPQALRATDLPLPTVAAKIDAWRREIADAWARVAIARCYAGERLKLVVAPTNAGESWRSSPSAQRERSLSLATML